MRSAPPFAILLLLLTPGCREPTAPLEAEILPPGESLYLVDEGNGFESLNLGLRVTGLRQRALQGLTVQLSSAGARRLTQDLDRAAIDAYTQPGEGRRGELRLEGLHLLVPADLDIDRVTLHLRLDGGTAIEITAPVTRYIQANRYRLPLRGCWFVSSGHSFGIEHRRWYNRSHFAWDLVKLDDADGMRAGKQQLEDYPAFGAPVLAPAAGRVLLADDSRPDMEPGKVGEAAATNFLLIDHGRGEQSKLAHLQQGSLLVRPDDRVTAGQAVARVGNSGRSDAPHLHLHFQRTRFDSGGAIERELPLPVQLGGYRLTSNLGVDVPVEHGRPRRGDFICAD